jgi:hypothetical protein
MAMPTTGTITQLFLEDCQKTCSRETWYGTYYDQNNSLQQRPRQGAHSGVDISSTTIDCVPATSSTAASGQPVYAAMAGTVIWAGFDPAGRGFGWSVVVRHGFGVRGNGHYTYSLYGHMGTVGTKQATDATKGSVSCLQVQPGQQVNPAGSTNPTIIGYQGSSGLTKPATHVHFTVFAGSQDLLTLTSPYVPNAVPASPDFYSCLQLTQGDQAPRTTVAAGQTGCTAGTWTSGPSMLSAHGYTALTSLQDGRVLVVSGDDGAGLTTETEVYDPVARQWSQTGNTNQPRYAFRPPVLLPSGKVLIAGGHDANVNDYATAELYDPSTGQWTFTGSLNTSRRYAVVVGLQDGRVLAATGAMDRLMAAVSSRLPRSTTRRLVNGHTPEPRRSGAKAPAASC